MHKLKLRPEKKEKDRQRLVKLATMLIQSIKTDAQLKTSSGKVKSKIVTTTNGALWNTVSCHRAPDRSHKYYNLHYKPSMNVYPNNLYMG